MRALFCAALSLACAFLLLKAHDNSVDDRVLKATSRAQVKAIREGIVQHIWGVPWKDLLTRQPDEVTPTYTPKPEDGLPSDVTGVASMERVTTTLRLPQQSGPEVVHTSAAFLYFPENPSGHLLVLHQGHGCTLDGSDQSNLDVAIRRLVAAHHAVAAMRMPLLQNRTVCRQENGDKSHLELMQHKLQKGTPLQFFLEPITRVVNYVKSKHPEYKEIDMAGLSGGGWTTTVYAAIDTRISKSFPIAGTVPLYLRGHNYNDDLEQFTPDLYSIAGFKDLYVLGASGKGRAQFQILNRYDTCCFGEKQHTVSPPPFLEAVNAYAADVQGAVRKLGPGSFTLFVSSQAHIHQVPLDGIEMILSQLSQSPKSGSS